MIKATKLTLFTCLLFLSQQLFSYNVPALRDTSKTHILDELATRPPYPSEYQINKNSFYIKYGFDITAKQIIDLHFATKNKYIFFIVSPVIAYVLLIIAYAFAIVTFSPAAVLFTVFAFSLWVLAWVFRVIGIVKLVQLKKIDLLNELIHYRKTGNSPFGKKQIPTKNSTDDYYELK